MKQLAVGATPEKNVRREEPEAGDVVLLLGGKTLVGEKLIVAGDYAVVAVTKPQPRTDIGQHRPVKRCCDFHRCHPVVLRTNAADDNNPAVGGIDQSSRILEARRFADSDRTVTTGVRGAPLPPRFQPGQIVAKILLGTERGERFPERAIQVYRAGILKRARDRFVNCRKHERGRDRLPRAGQVDKLPHIPAVQFNLVDRLVGAGTAQFRRAVGGQHQHRYAIH